MVAATVVLIRLHVSHQDSPLHPALQYPQPDTHRDIARAVS